MDGKQNQTAATPPLASLEDWHVSLMPDGRSEVRIVINDKDEARAWCAWMFQKVEDMTDEL